jgi:hypothetical protein
MRPRLPWSLVICAALSLAGCASKPRAARPTPLAIGDFQPLFPRDGTPRGWTVRSWHDVSQPAPPEARWVVRDGVLHGSSPGGTWLVSDEEYEDFILEFEFRLGERGNSGVGLRFPPSGDPAVEGMEAQLVDPGYFGGRHVPEPWELTGALYKAAPPTTTTYAPGEWNRCSITCRGEFVRVAINGTRVLDLNLRQETGELPRGRPLAERPRRGRIGFQEISRAGGQTRIRNARIRILN